ncbi:3-hydroxyphenylacetate 6-hydroxylase [Sphaceloma murrayae]|uniref:3-hydroxyphenylacetate 6-hydroxylase n=1 Tax=Sphaceloma murrayae TaxID=2082308 RepID=A0A2K1QTB9_9PEZI|nr:3-hydroxyphenylacetate 6-hydroxylase [Sphaceloma murrayae]
MPFTLINPLWLALSSLLVWALALIVRSKLRARKYRLPPRVPGIPLIGNTLQFPADLSDQIVWAKKLADQYGEMFTVQLGAADWVFLNSSRVVSDIMEKKAAITSSKPEMPMAQGVMSADRRLLFMPYGDRWRELRKIMHGILNSRRMIDFSAYQDTESKQMLFEYLKSPDLWYKANQRYTMAVVVSFVFGRRPMLNDPNADALFQQAEDVIMAMQPGKNLVDGFPILAKLPSFLHWWRRKGEHYLAESIRVYDYEVNHIKALMDAGKAPPCFAVDFLQATANSHFDELQKTFVMGTLLEAGSDTTRVAISQMLAGAVLYPDWVERAREHLDRVCGSLEKGEQLRLPVWEDRNELTYITAAVKEGFRWRPMIPLGVPHVLSADLDYEGYKFPAGTTVTWNNFYIGLNPEEHEQPERYWPERFMNEDVGNVLKGHWAFGPGRRVCVGYNMAETNAWMALSRLLYCFNFEANPDKPIDSFRTEWLEFKKAPFDMKITPRSPAHVKLIEEAYASI